MARGLAAACALAASMSSPTSAADGSGSVFSTVLSDDARIRFHAGEVENNRPKLLPELPAVPGPPSPWYLAQWGQRSYITAADLRRDDPSTRDPALGIADLAFAAPDAHSHLWVYGSDRTRTYELSQQGGVLVDSGGSDLFLSVGREAIAPDATLDQDLVYDVDARIRHASITYRDREAERLRTVQSQVFSGFGLLFADPQGRGSQFVFMQLPISASGRLLPDPFYMCSISNGHPNLLYLPGSDDVPQILPFRDGAAGFHHLTYDLGGDVRRMVSRGYDCGGRRIEWSPEARQLGNWRLTGFYVGIESNDRKAGEPAADGAVSTAIQVRSLDIRRKSRK